MQGKRDEPGRKGEKISRMTTGIKARGKLTIPDGKYTNYNN